AQRELVDQRSRRWRYECPVNAAAQASAAQGVPRAFRGRHRMEVKQLEFVTRIALALIVAGMLPLAGDALVTQNRAAIHLTERRTQLPTVRDMVNGQSVHNQRADDRINFDARLVRSA